MNFGRIAGVIVGIMLVVAATLFFLFRYTFTTGRLYQVQTALGIDAPPPERHIVPEGFTGWALIHYGIEGAPKLPVVDGVTVAEYPESGRLVGITAAHNAPRRRKRATFLGSSLSSQLTKTTAATTAMKTRMRRPIGQPLGICRVNNATGPRLPLL